MNEEIIWTSLKGLYPYQANIIHNLWDGRYYSSCFYSIHVLAKSSADACLQIDNFRDEIEIFLRNKRVKRGNKSVRLIRKSDSLKFRYNGKPVRRLKYRGIVLNENGQWTNYE